MNKRTDDITIDQALLEIRQSTSSSFYRDLWAEATDFAELPVCTSQYLAQTPLSRRRYKDATSLVKIVATGAGPALSEWAFDDIAKEQWGVIARRPMVYMENAHEALEKSVWCYENGMVPLIGEADPDIAAFAAAKYAIDSLITDQESIEKLGNYLTQRTEPLDCISVIGLTFDVDMLRRFSPYARRIRLVRATPFIGAFSEADLTDPHHFSPHESCMLETLDGVEVVTKNRLLITPIIRVAVG